MRVGDTGLELDENGALPMVAIGQRARDREGFDVVVLLTDLPRRAGAQPVVADAGTADRVGLVSVEVDVRLGLSGARGRVRLLAGLVRANRPWRLVPSMSPAVAAAAAGAAFGIFYSNIWSLAAALGVVRLVVVTLMALVAMVAWLILDHQLWERRTDRSLREEAILSNASTVLTVATGVLVMFALLFVIALVAAVVVIPPSYLGGNLGREAGVDDYLVIAWLSCAMGTVAGALGSGFADEGAVRQAAYSRREQERRARLDQRDVETG